MRLADRVALVTGAARGIGRGIALRFADEGAHVVVAELDVDTAQVTVGEVEAKSRRALAVECNVTQAASVQAAVERALDEFGRIDILVNNAGTGQRVVETVDLDEAEWDRVLAVNITGVFICSKYVGRQMMRQDSGKIINLSSINGISGPPLVSAYNAAKWAVIGFTQDPRGRTGAVPRQRERDLPRPGGHRLPESQHGGAGGGDGYSGSRLAGAAAAVRAAGALDDAGGHRGRRHVSGVRRLGPHDRRASRRIRWLGRRVRGSAKAPGYVISRPLAGDVSARDYMLAPHHFPIYLQRCYPSARLLTAFPRL